jgi:hypothetical protein
MLFFLSSPSYLQQSKLSHKNVVKWEINNIFMAKFRLLQVRGGGEEEQHFMAKFRVPQVRGGYTTG